MFMIICYGLIFIALPVGMFFTFRRPKIWKYNTLIGSEIFSVALCIIRGIYINHSFAGIGEIISIMVVFPAYVIMLIVTVTVCLRTRYRWCFKDNPGFCG